MRLLPAPSNKTVSDSESIPKWANWDWEVWRLRNGTLILSFGKSGLQVLKRIEWKDRGIKAKEPKTAYDYLNAGRGASADREFRRAVELYDKALALDAKIPYAHWERGENLAELGKWEEAVKDLNAAQNLVGGILMREKAKLEMKLGRFEEALQDANEFLGETKADAEKGGAWLLMARIHLKLKNYDKAIAAARQAMELRYKKSEFKSVCVSVSADDRLRLDITIPDAPAHLVIALHDLFQSPKSGTWEPQE